MKVPATARRDPLAELEAHARRIVRVSAGWEAAPAASLARDLAVALAELDWCRALHRQLERSLLQAECLVDSELMQPQQQPGDRARLQGRLFSIEAERRRLTLARHDQLRELYQRLLALLNKYVYLVPENEQ